jgi:hypothetical protein
MQNSDDPPVRVENLIAVSEGGPLLSLINEQSTPHFTAIRSCLSSFPHSLEITGIVRARDYELTEVSDKEDSISIQASSIIKGEKAKQKSFLNGTILLLQMGTGG